MDLSRCISQSTSILPSGIDTVRALHQTVVSLRAALENSQTELTRLKDKIKSRAEYREAIEKLSLENHILRRRIIDENNLKCDHLQSQVDDGYLKSNQLNNQVDDIDYHDSNVDILRNSEVIIENNLDEIYSKRTAEQIDTVEDTNIHIVDNTVNIVSDLKITTDLNNVEKETTRTNTYDKNTKLNSDVNKIEKIETKGDSEINYKEIDKTKTELNKFDKSDQININRSKSNNVNLEVNGIIIRMEKKRDSRRLQVDVNQDAENNELKEKTSIDQQTNETANKNVIPKIELPGTNVQEEPQETTMSKQVPEENKNTDNKTVNLDIEKDVENLSLKSLSEGDNSVFSDNDVQHEHNKIESENESEEVDDIELIFTTEETKEIGALQEDLVSITETEKWTKRSTTDTPVLLNFKTVDFDSGDLNGDNMDDDVFDNQDPDLTSTHKEESIQKHSTRIENRGSSGESNKKLLQTSMASDTLKQQKSTESTDSYVDSSFENKSLEKDESFDQFEERDKRLQKMWSQCSVLVETDISKCGVLEEPEVPNLSGRRNTCPNPLAYRPIIHRDSIGKSGANRTYGLKYGSRSPRNSVGMAPMRPILNEKNSPKTESEAQTDISALPCPWKSESYLAHKVSHNFTTLPSKFALPVCQQPKIRLSEKTQEARRVLLSDINFTSMVPELSRSADHLCQEGNENTPQYQTYTRGPFLRTPEVPRKYDWTDSLTSPNFGRYYSPSDYSNFGSSRFDGSNQHMSRYRGSLTSINSPSQYEISTGGRSTFSSSYWKQNCPASFESYRGTSFSSRPTFGSVPTSPTRQHRSRSVPLVQRSVDGGYSGLTGSRYSFGRSHSRPTSQWGFGQRSKTRSRVTFEDTNLRFSNRTNHSLPDLRSDSYDSGGDSTDSLVEEAEHYLRRSIDCMVSGGTGIGHSGTGCEGWKTEKTRARRASAPDPVRETDPPSGSTPYLPRQARDLRPGHWVKVIGPEGRVRGGRVRHVGPIAEQISQTQSAGKDISYVGVELATPTGNSDGSYQGRRFFDCEPDHAIFVPFKKVIMAWST